MPSREDAGAFLTEKAADFCGMKAYTGEDGSAILSIVDK